MLAVVVAKAGRCTRIANNVETYSTLQLNSNTRGRSQHYERDNDPKLLRMLQPT